MAFEFTDLDLLTDGTIDLRVEQKVPADPSRGHVPAYHYAIARHGSSERIGAIRLRIGHVPALLTAGHIGYEIEEGHRGHHFAARACLLLARVARAHRLGRVIITCDPENIASRRTCERIGASFRGIYDVPADHEMYRQGVRKVCRYEWTVPGEGDNRR